MSIDIEVGIFVEKADEDLSFHCHYRHQFAAINQFLRSIGLAEHDEPDNFAGHSPFQRTATKSLYPFKEIVWNLEQYTGCSFPHISEAGAETALYLPYPFESVLRPPAQWGIELGCLGSSVHLFAECRVLAKVLGIYDEIEDATNRDAVVLMLERLLNLDKKEKTMPFSLLRKHVQEQDPMLAENPWSVVGTGACMTLYEAAKCSVKYQAALVIH